MLQIEPTAIVDPALGESGVHNAGFAAMLVEQCRGLEDSLGFWCNVQTTPNSFKSSLRQLPNVHPLFSTKFFGLFNKSGNTVSHWPWIRQLAREYIAALSQIASRWHGERVRVLHHTLSWEHATALNLAIRQVGKSGADLLHLCLLMYYPGTLSGDIRSRLNRLRFRQAFHGLSQIANVRLFASCYEYAEAYANLLGRQQVLHIHPIFLVHGERKGYAENAGTPGNSEQTPKRTLMYAGLVKEEKGFRRLPSRLEQASSLGNPGDTWIVQYVGKQSRLESEHKTLSELAALSARNSAVTIHAGFWDDRTLVQEFKQADRLLLDYDPHAYRHKTSGQLWLAAWHDLEVILPRESWLAHEAARLGVRHAFVEDGWPTAACERNRDGLDAAYRDALFQQFLPWLQSQN